MRGHFLDHSEKISSQGAETSICRRSEDVMQAVWANNGFFTGLGLVFVSRGPLIPPKFDKTGGRCVSVCVCVFTEPLLPEYVFGSSTSPMFEYAELAWICPAPLPTFFIKMLWLGYLRRQFVNSVWPLTSPPARVLHLWCLRFRERVRARRSRFFTVLRPLLVWSQQRGTSR